MILEAWTIYRDMRLYQGAFFVYHHFPRNGRSYFRRSPTCVRESLEEARACLPKGRGLRRQERAPHDDPTVVETWF